ncbi:MAG: phage Gp37/Gp68 family protein [Verrucomicrobiota bacterium]
MSENSKIEWTDHTFNPWWGCVKVSPGCANCYAETFSKRTGNKVWGADAPRRFFGDKHWNEPRKWNEQAKAADVRHRVFCASMADVYEDREDLERERSRLFHLINETPHLDWLLLTKRPENVVPLTPTPGGYLPKNVWLGTTVEDQQRAHQRIPKLLETPASVRFLSCEPLLELVNLPTLSGIDWVIAGGESGPKCRLFDSDWARELRDECRRTGTAFFMKQMGGVRKPFPEIPSDLMIREFPERKEVAR